MANNKITKKNVIIQAPHIESLYKDACRIIDRAQQTAYSAVNETLIKRNWLLGMRIQHEVLKEQRAEYGEQVIMKLSGELTEKYGRGFKKSNLYSFVSFYQSHPDFFQSPTGKSSIRLSWTHYNIIQQELTAEGRAWYEKEAANEMWSTRTLQRNVSSQYYHRLLQSQDKTIVHDERDYFEPIGVELDYAENHIDANCDYYSDIDKKSYQRVVCTYREAAEDGNLNALWCLGCALNLRNSIFKEKYDVFGLTYYYLSLAIQKGHLASIPSLCEILMQDEKHKEAFMFTYIGAQKKEIYCMWNLAMYYLCGITVSKSEDRAVELFESILNIINTKDSDKTAFYYSHYDGIKKDEILELKECTEHNLKIVKSNSDSWRKYFDIEVCRKYQKILDMLIKEHCLDPSYTGEMYASKIKELMNQ